MTTDHNKIIRRQAFDIMEQALKLLDEIKEYRSATLLDHAITLLALRPDTGCKADFTQPNERAEDSKQ